MNLFCSQINNALCKNFIFIDVRFKKKYLFILNELLKLNLIKSFSYDKKIIRVYFRYFKNKPVFFLYCKISSGKKINFGYNKIINLKKNENTFIDIFSSNACSFSDKNILFFKGSGGIYILKINFLM